MADLLQMQRGRRQAEWEHTAALLMIIQRVAGNKHARFDNPYAERSSDRDEWDKVKRRKRGIENESNDLRS